MTNTTKDDELRERLDIRSRLRNLSIFKLGFGFDTYELVEFIRQYGIEQRIDELEDIDTQRDHNMSYLGRRMSESEADNLATSRIKQRIAELHNS